MTYTRAPAGLDCTFSPPGPDLSGEGGAAAPECAPVSPDHANPDQRSAGLTSGRAGPEQVQREAEARQIRSGEGLGSFARAIKLLGKRIWYFGGLAMHGSE